VGRRGKGMTATNDDWFPTPIRDTAPAEIKVNGQCKKLAANQLMDSSGKIWEVQSMSVSNHKTMMITAIRCAEYL
jgi:hypothetical protein